MSQTQNCPVGSKNFALNAFLYTFVPFIFIMGTLVTVLVLMPGWKAPFSNTIGFFLVKNIWARKLFKSWEDKPQRFIRGARFAHKLGLVRPKVFAFIQKFAADKTSFKRASVTWRGFRNITADFKSLESVISKNNFRFIIIMGKYDQVIRTRQAESFLKKINQQDALIEIECGHDFFRQENIALLSPHIKI